MIHDQADELRQLVRRRAASGSTAGPTAPLVIVSGGKGGVGTTTIAVNLAVALARQGRRAVFVDADLDHGGHARLTTQPDRGSVVDVLAGRRSVHEVLERGPSGIQVVCGAWASDARTEFSDAAQQRLITDLAHLAPSAEVVVVDAGSGRGPLAGRLWRASSAVLVVTTADDVSLMQSYAAIKVLAAMETETTAATRIHTLVNRTNDAPTAAGVQERIGEACRRFLGLRVHAGGTVGDSDMPASGETVPVFAARSEPARALDRLSDTLWAQLQMHGAAQREVRRANAS